MDRIDSYIQQAFAKFQDVPEIQAQKEEMADHLRDRVADAIGQGMGEKEAFASATAAMSDAMPDLEQTLAGFLRPEFRPEFQRTSQPKPHTKEIYINFYRYHRAVMLMFAQVLFTVMMFVICGLYADYKHWEWSEFLVGITGFIIPLMELFIVYSIIRFMVNPLRIKRVSASPWRMLAKYLMGFVIICIPLLFMVCGIPQEVDKVFTFLLILLLFYSVFFIVFSSWGWFRQDRYMKAPDITQDTSLAKWGLLLTAIFLAIPLILIQVAVTRIAEFARISREHGGATGSVVYRINELTNNEKRLQEQLQRIQMELNDARLDQMYRPQNASIVGDEMEYSPMTSLNPPTVYLNRKERPTLRDGMAATVFDPQRPFNSRLWSVSGFKGDFKIIDTGTRLMPYIHGGGMSSDTMGGIPGGGMPGMGGMMLPGGMKVEPGMMPPMFVGGIGPAGGFAPPGYQPPERKEHTITLDSDFPATDLAENVICARQFPFEEYKLGMIQAVAPETVADGETFPVRIGVGNLDARNAKLLLTVEYGDGLHQDAIPSGATLFLGFLGAREYREYKADFTVANSTGNADANNNGTNGNEHTLKLTLRNESGQVIAETSVAVNR